MHEYHQVIFDEDALVKYLQSLPGNETDRYYFVLLARPKYDATKRVKHTGQSIKRGFSTKDMLLQKLRQLEMRKDSVLTKGEQIPGECLALYLMPSPRDILKASVSLMGLMAEKMGTRILDPNFVVPDPVKLARDALHTARTKASAVVTFDFDVDKEARPDLRERLLELAYPATTVIETRGGYHVQVQPDLVPTVAKKIWHREFQALGPEQTGDLLSPVPGCCQGGFVPKVLKYPTPF
jgi:hypothetical protein